MTLTLVRFFFSLSLILTLLFFFTRRETYPPNRILNQVGTVWVIAGPDCHFRLPLSPPEACNKLQSLYECLPRTEHLHYASQTSVEVSVYRNSRPYTSMTLTQRIYHDLDPTNDTYTFLSLTRWSQIRHLLPPLHSTPTHLRCPLLTVINPIHSHTCIIEAF